MEPFSAITLRFTSWRFEHWRLLMVITYNYNILLWLLLCCSIYGGELFDRAIREDFLLTEKACVCIMRQICEAVEFIHSQNIIHLDMKVWCFSSSSSTCLLVYSAYLCSPNKWKVVHCNSKKVKPARKCSFVIHVIHCRGLHLSGLNRANTRCFGVK